MKKELSFNLILKDQAQKLLDDFATVMNVRILFIGRDGKVLKRGRNAECTPFCRLMQSKYFGLEACLKLDEEMEKKSSLSGKCECYTCHAGLCEAVMPVTAPGAGLLGYLMVGQLRSCTELPEKLQAMATSDQAKKELRATFQALPYYTREAFEKMSELLELLVDYIVRCELVKLNEDLFYLRVCDYIDAHFKQEISPRTAARALGFSVSSLAHTLHEKGHAPFLNLLTERRLKHAEKLMREMPNLTIAEAALQSGFQDPYYFSRIYRKYRGISPRKFKDVSVPLPQSSD